MGWSSPARRRDPGNREADYRVATGDRESKLTRLSGRFARTDLERHPVQRTRVYSWGAQDADAPGIENPLAQKFLEMSHHDVTRCAREQRVIHPREYRCRNVRQLSEFATVRPKTDRQFIEPRIERAVHQ